MSRTPQINVGLFGFGTVGSHVAKILDKNHVLIAERLGFPIHLKKICEPDPKKKGLVPNGKLVTKPNELLDDPEISIVVELIGDKPVAREIIMQALDLGKNVVTANKAILAKHGEEIYQAAIKNEVNIRFEAAVAGAIPVLRAIRESFTADTIKSILGIINGTSNYILSEIAEKKKPFQEVLVEAQKAGYAEANPASDIEGHDTAHKLAILSTMSFGQLVGVDKIHTEGITDITPFDIEMADRFGHTIKLLAIAKHSGGEIEARVHPTLISSKHMLASVKGVFNAVMMEGEAFGPSLFYGLGAGGAPTATAVISDILEMARNIAFRVQGVPPLGIPFEKIGKAKLKPIEEIECSYYLRFNALDKPGVFAKIAQVLGSHQISISSVVQQGREEGKEVPIVVLTHKAKEKNMKAALEQVNALPIVTKKTLFLRIES